jgi:2-hydroxy-3-keto-5-methylthiopentenyl-1-phosphate phosphatase
VRLVLDFDGTITEVDTLHLVLEQFGDREIYARVEGALGRSMTLNEVIAAEFKTVTAPLDEVVEWLFENARIRPGFAELARERQPLIVSSGFHETIEPLLAREGVLSAVELRANRVDPRPDGWCVFFRNRADCGTCGEPCKRRDLEQLRRVDRSVPTGQDLSGDGEVVFVGDGYSDRCAALAADRVFARDGLAEWLQGQGVPFEPFTDFRELAERL